MKNQTPLIISINIAALMVLMDLSAINIALPTIKEHFSISVSTVSIILMASMLTATGTALTIGKLIESIDYKQILLWSFFIFAITTTLSSQITNFYWFIPLRMLQGTAEAALYVSGPALIKKLMKEGKQQKEYGKWMMSCGIGISLGPILGGLLISHFGWHFVFLLNLPLAIIGFYFASKLPPGKSSFSNERFDIKGSIYSFLFLAFFILFFNFLSYPEIPISMIWGSILLCILFLVAFIKHEKASHSPLLDLRLFSIENFRQANIGFFLFFFVNVGSRFLRPFYFEETRLLDTTTSGILMMVSPSIMLLVSGFIHRIEKYISTKHMLIAGNVLLSISMLMFSFWDPSSSLTYIICSMIILGLAMGIYYPTTTQIGMKSLPKGKHGMGSASISVSKSMGKLMGVLLFGLLFQVFLELISSKSSTETLIESNAMRFVFFIAFIIGIANTLFSFRIKSN